MVSHIYTHSRKVLRFKDFTAQFEKSPPHIHPRWVVQLHFLRNCSVVCWYVSRCGTPTAEQLGWKERSERSETVLFGLPVQFHCGSMQANYHSTSCQSLVSVWDFCNAIVTKWCPGQQKTGSFCEAKGLWPRLIDIWDMTFWLHETDPFCNKLHHQSRDQ